MTLHKDLELESSGFIPNKVIVTRRLVPMLTFEYLFPHWSLSCKTKRDQRSKKHKLSNVLHKLTPAAINPPTTAGSSTPVVTSESWALSRFAKAVECA